MNFIIDFYKDLETLELILFWGIIIVIILLLVFSIIMTNKNNKLQKLIVKKNQKEITDNKYEELPIKDENQQLELSKDNQLYNENKEEFESSINMPEIPQIKNNEKEDSENIFETIRTEKKFIAEEHVMEYNNELFSISNIQKASQEIDGKNPIKQENNTINNRQIEIPTGPYQRNVLREMSLSQTSPIGLTPPKKKNDENYQLAKDLEDSLNVEEKENYENKNELKKEETRELRRNRIENISNYNKELIENKNVELIHKNNIAKEFQNNKKEHKETYIQKENENKQENFNNKKTEKIQLNQLKQKELAQKNQIEKENIKKEISSIQNTSPRKTEIKTDESNERKSNFESFSNNKQEKTIIETKKHEFEKENYQSNIDPTVKELLNSVTTIEKTEKSKSASEKYLEEVSKKLAAADVSDEIERTNYELEQEENAIISYKELMEKKDSIKTIDEEEAVISIEELMNRNNKQKEHQETDNKLYNLTDEEENDDFINELKQFRNDL